MLKNVLISGLSILFTISANSQSVFSSRDLLKQNAWVDSVFSKLNLDQKIGQLFMVAAYSNRDEKHYSEIEDLIKEYQIGGLIFFQGGPVRQVQLTNRYQKVSNIPLLNGMDLEWGLGMRLDSTLSFPKQMTLGALKKDHLIKDMGAEIARQMKLIGVHVNFAPVVDINNNPANPVIGYRSFGENKEKVTQKGIAYMNGLQENGVMATMKHFPGHGDTDTDSHLDLPVIRHGKERLDDIELYPFKKLIDAGVTSTMVAHINLPLIDPAPNRPTTLSSKVVTDILKDELEFRGLIFTDALNMKGVAKYYKPGEADLEALKAGNDVVLFPLDVPKAVRRIKREIRRGNISEEEIDRRVKKMLHAKFWTGAYKFQPISSHNLIGKLNNSQAKMIRHNLYREAITVVKNENELLPVKILDTAHFASVALNTGRETDFQNYLDKYAPFLHFTIGEEAGDHQYNDLLDKLSRFEVVVAGVHGMNNSKRSNFGLRKKDLDFLKELNNQTKLIVSVFGNAYSLSEFENFDHVLCTYEDVEETQSLAAQLIFGGIGGKGELPVTASDIYPEGYGIQTKTLKRFSFSVPEDVQMSSSELARIDEIVREAIADTATPGAQILIARHGKVIFNKSYGHYTYDSLREVTDETIYDLASITKVVATLQTVMFLEERGWIDLDKKASYYLPELKKTNKKDMIIRDILTHQAGLWPYIPYWKQTVKEMGIDSTYYSMYPNQEFGIQVAPTLYAKNSLQDSLWKWTIESKIREKEPRTPYDYKYSDMGYYILQKISERILNQPMEDFLQQNFYEPLGMNTTCYLPLCKFSADRIAPTELDSYFRMNSVHGMVHDQGAAMYGGVAGHAGVFSNAIDLAKILQMNLQGGVYGGIRYLEAETLKKFTSQQYLPNRRGIGWDKPAEYFNGPTSDYVSYETFGHTGFTGTAAWADPEFGLVYIFLSNRIHPSAENRKLIENNIRTRIQDAIYRSIWHYQLYNNEHIPE